MTGVARIPSGWVFDSGGHRCVIDMNNLWKNMCSIGSLLSYCTALIFEYQGFSERAPTSGRVRRTPFAGETRPAITTHNRIPWWRLHRSVTGRRTENASWSVNSLRSTAYVVFGLARSADLLYVYHSIFCFLSLTHAQYSKFAFRVKPTLDWTVRNYNTARSHEHRLCSYNIHINVLSNVRLAC